MTSLLQQSHHQDMERVTRSKVGSRFGGRMPFFPGDQQFDSASGSNHLQQPEPPILGVSEPSAGVSWMAGVRISGDNSRVVFSPAQVGLAILAGARLPLPLGVSWPVLWVEAELGYDSAGGGTFNTGLNTAAVSWRVCSESEFDTEWPWIFPIGTDGILATVGSGTPIRVAYGVAVGEIFRSARESFTTGAFDSSRSHLRTPNFIPYRSIFQCGTSTPYPVF
jgi:hypothetical protein